MGIKDFKINSSLKDLEKNKNLTGSLSFFARRDDESMYLYKNNHLDLKSSSLLIDATFIFKNDTLKRLEFEKIGDSSNGDFQKAYNDLSSKYGTPISFPGKNLLYKEYAWLYKDLILRLKPLKFSFLLIYGKKPTVKHDWVYSDRKGKGNNSVRIDLDYWEKLVNSNLTISLFEKDLPEWKTIGDNNHVDYDLNFKTRKRDIPQFSITYKLNNYDIEITADTSSKIIEDYQFSKIRDPIVLKNIKNSLIKLGYKRDEDVKTDNTVFYLNKAKKIDVMVIQKTDGFDFKIYKTSTK
jgi:hypothetical protein